MSGAYIYMLGRSYCWASVVEKAPNSMGKISAAEVPSATLRTGSSTPRHESCVTQSICEALRFRMTILWEN
jgi:hypothetical protein